MLKIYKNSRSFGTVIDIVSKGILDTTLLTKIKSSKVKLVEVFDEYDKILKQGNGFQLPRYDYNKNKGIDPIVLGDLKHSEISSMYSKFFVPKRLDSRVIYDEIMASSSEYCPYCGVLKDIEELDHFLPKSKYPQFSILTSNLIPSCKTCNQTYKASSFAICYEEQIIHPYIDLPHFFEEKWIDVELNINEHEEVRFFSSPPNSWSRNDQRRALFHFEKFDLAKRYATHVKDECLGLLKDIKNLQAHFENEIIIEMIIQHKIDEIANPNDCRKVLLEAIKSDLLQAIPVHNVFPNVITCPRCRGTGKIIGLACDVCKGMGIIKESIVCNEEVFKQVECPSCFCKSLDLDCDICRGEGNISLDKARNIEK